MGLGDVDYDSQIDHEISHLALPKYNCDMWPKPCDEACPPMTFAKRKSNNSLPFEYLTQSGLLPTPLLSRYDRSHGIVYIESTSTTKTSPFPTRNAGHLPELGCIMYKIHW